MKRPECRSELVLRARRGPLSGSERTALDAHLSSCESCQLTDMLVRDFEADRQVQPLDGARIERLALLGRGSGAQRAANLGDIRRGRPVRTVLLAAACILFAAAGASAGFNLLTRGEPEPAPSVELSTNAARTAPAEQRPIPRVAPVHSEAEPAPEPAPAQRTLTHTTDSARVLFQKASDARREGNTTAAVALYRRLQREFPKSSEAAVSRVRLGGVLLAQGDAKSALRQFDAYLAGGRAPGGLAPEALYGRGRALSVLGRVSDEQRTWSRLLAEFPSSPYAAHARRRLGNEAIRAGAD